jgi:hypothetical protein
MSTTVKEVEQSDVDSGVDVTRKLELYNSAHYWDDVVRQLNKATGYDFSHTKGKAIIKSGEVQELKRIQSVLNEINLKTKIV